MSQTTQEQRLATLLAFFTEDCSGSPALPPGGASPAATFGEKQRLLRGLVNTRPPRPVPPHILAVQDAYLAAQREEKGVVRVEDLQPAHPGQSLYLWQGDITRLAADGIVNAANSALLGCFVPCHGCIDNAIHTAAGVQLRQACAERMERQGHPQPTGTAQITSGYNLPAKHVLHTVGPIVRGEVTDEHRAQLAACYNSCLDLAAQHGLTSLAFCCISTGEYHFPAHRAAEIAIATVRAWLAERGSNIKVVFNVFHDDDCRLYQYLLGE